MLHLTVQERFPFSNFAVNVLGCLVVGMVAGWPSAIIRSS